MHTPYCQNRQNLLEIIMKDEMKKHVEAMQEFHRPTLTLKAGTSTRTGKLMSSLLDVPIVEDAPIKPAPVVHSEAHRANEIIQQKEKQRKIKLAGIWLNSFPVIKEYKLLEVGINKQLRDLMKAGEFEFGLNHLKEVIRLHCTSKKYLALDKDGTRYALENKRE